MKLLSVNVGLPNEVLWKGKPVLTGIFKYPTPEPVYVHSLGMEGDGQADPVYHGGVDKAVYAYASEHYAYWRDTLPDYPLESGNFGENLTTMGLLDADVRLGDVFRVGSAQLQVMQPRFPCFKLGLRFGDASMVTHFKRARRHGIYFRVIEPGQLQTGDVIELIAPSPHSVTVQEVVDAYYEPQTHADSIKAMLAIAEFPAMLRQHFAKF